MKLFTIGFTQRSAENFFSALSSARVKRVADVRLNNVSQLAGFAKREDLRWFLKTICGADYLHLPELAPSQEILEAYKKNKGLWAVYEKDFLQLMAERKAEQTLSGILSDRDCLLCSEKEPEKCHRRLVAEYLKEKWGNVEIVHLL
ncbi:MAG: DUF488 domain-containing protein [Desulfobacterales bacterium]